jgi:hypothetical protein
MTSEYSAPGIPGFMKADELQWLYAMASHMDSVVETGCWKGRSTHALLSGCKGPVYAVDHWEGSTDGAPHTYDDVLTHDVFEDFKANVGHFPNLNVRRGSSLDVAGDVPEVDMVFIDDDHTYEHVKKVLALYAPKARKLICGHDWDWPGVRQAVSEFFGGAVRVGPCGIWSHIVAPEYMPAEDLSKRDIRLFFATPAYGGTVTTAHSCSMLATTVLLNALNIRHCLSIVPNDSLITRARNMQVASMLADPRGWTHLMFIDADIRWDARDVLKLLEADKDMVCGCYPMKKEKLQFPMNLIGRRVDVDRETGCCEIVDAPTGFLMIKRTVFEQLMAAHPELHCQFCEEQTEAELEYSYALFDCMITPPPPNARRQINRYKSEDFGFSQRWRELGGKIWLNPYIRLRHTGQKEYEGAPIDAMTPLSAVAV